MKTLQVTHNPANDPVRFPSGVTYLKIDDDQDANDAVMKFAKKEKQVVLSYKKVPNQWMQ